jgi:hypothetical protein
LSVQPPAPPPESPPPPPPGTPVPRPPAPLRPPPPYIEPSRLRPREHWYWVAGAVGVLGVAASVVLFVGFFSSLVDDLTGPLTELRAPGQETLELEPGAERTIYRQEREDGAPIPNAAGRDPACSVTRAGGGLVELDDNEFGWTLKRNGDRYEALYDFRIAEGGSYRVACNTKDDNLAAIPLAIGETIGLWDLLKKGGGALALFFGAIVIAAAIGIVTAVRRDAHKRRLQHEAMQR